MRSEAGKQTGEFNAFESLDAEGREALRRNLEELLERWNTSGDETVMVSSDYLEVVATRK